MAFRSRDAFNYAFLGIVAMFVLPIAFLGIAAIPVRYVPWPAAAYFVAGRRLDMTIVGVACLVLAGFMLLLAHGI